MEGERALQPLYSALEVPLLLLVTFALCAPTFFVVNTLAGLLPGAVQALLRGQAALAIALASFAPLTGLVYLSGVEYATALVWSGGLFGLAALAGHLVLRRARRPRVRRAPRHRVMLRVWLALSLLVAIQLARVLRPCVGSPADPVELFRAGRRGNAYLFLIRLVLRVLSGAP